MDKKPRTYFGEYRISKQIHREIANPLQSSSENTETGGWLVPENNVIREQNTLKQ